MLNTMVKFRLNLVGKFNGLTQWLMLVIPNFANLMVKFKLYIVPNLMVQFRLNILPKLVAKHSA